MPAITRKLNVGVAGNSPGQSNKGSARSTHAWIRPRTMRFDRRHDGRFRFGQWLLLVTAVVLCSSVVLAQDSNPPDAAPVNAYPQNPATPGQSAGDAQQT